ncbi:hypothetical protein V5O48_010783 [Marasmius crinis-equi]|uniref:Retrotransposon gag domain-containing protein n=1 Tax=Marasmius crinis-equi TaxID=585013 RepID=A0ABR3F7G1_9AGAR
MTTISPTQRKDGQSCPPSATRFQSDFGPVDPKGSSQMSLDQHYMMGEYASLSEYITEFKQLATETEYNNEALLCFFKKGLNPRLRNRVAGVNPELEGLEQYKLVAVRMQNQWSKVQVEVKA